MVEDVLDAELQEAVAAGDVREVRRLWLRREDAFVARHRLEPPGRRRPIMQEEQDAGAQLLELMRRSPEARVDWQELWASQGIDPPDPPPEEVGSSASAASPTVTPLHRTSATERVVERIRARIRDSGGGSSPTEGT